MSSNDLRVCKGFSKLEHFGVVHDDSSANLHKTLNQFTSSFAEDCRVTPRTPHPENKAILIDELICFGTAIDRDTN